MNLFQLLTFQVPLHSVKKGCIIYNFTTSLNSNHWTLAVNDDDVATKDIRVFLGFKNWNLEKLICIDTFGREKPIVFFLAKYVCVKYMTFFTEIHLNESVYNWLIKFANI